MYLRLRYGFRRSFFAKMAKIPRQLAIGNMQLANYSLNGIRLLLIRHSDIPEPLPIAYCPLPVAYWIVKWNVFFLLTGSKTGIRVKSLHGW
jgi:hypothetical protein